MSTSIIPSRYTLIRDLQQDRFLGCNNEGIYLVYDPYIKKLLVQKHIPPDDVRSGFAAREIEILCQLRGHPNISHLEQYDLNASRCLLQPSATIWTGFCNNGSLGDMINSLGGGEELLVREQFLWHVLRSLVEAVSYCQLGDARDGFEMDAKWNIIYHRDIQPNNIFLTIDAKPNSEFPRVVLGDFGCSTSLRDIAAGKSDPYLTERLDLNFAPPESPAFSLRSDIYQIGLVMWCLIFAERHPGKRRYDSLPFDVMENEVYSKELRYIVTACLGVDLEMRPTVEQLVWSLTVEPEVKRWDWSGCVSFDVLELATPVLDYGEAVAC